MEEDLLQYIDINLNPLGNEEAKKFGLVKDRLAEEERAGNLLFLYRGETATNILQRLSRGGIGIPDPELFERVFDFGDKARHFALDVYDGNRDYLRGINDCSEQTLSRIFDRICNVLSTARLKAKVDRCTSRPFQGYFLDHDNRRHFLDRVNRAYNSDGKLRIRDNYS